MAFFPKYKSKAILHLIKVKLFQPGVFSVKYNIAADIFFFLNFSCCALC